MLSTVMSEQAGSSYCSSVGGNVACPRARTRGPCSAPPGNSTCAVPRRGYTFPAIKRNGAALSGYTRLEGCRPDMSEARHWCMRGPCFGPSALFISGEFHYLALQARLVCFAPLALGRAHAPRPRSGGGIPRVRAREEACPASALGRRHAPRPRSGGRIPRVRAPVNPHTLAGREFVDDVDAAYIPARSWDIPAWDITVRYSANGTKHTSLYSAKGA